MNEHTFEGISDIGIDDLGKAGKLLANKGADGGKILDLRRADKA